MTAKILVVDDEPDVLRLIGYSLQIEGYNVVTATNGSDALRKVAADQPDLVVLDLMLPDISGIDICQQLRENPATACLPIMMLSARTQVTDKVRCLQAGADDYVSKPVDSDEMVARVRAMLKFTDRLRQAGPSHQGTISTFIGAKGGVGTTTLVLNLATALVQQKKSVLVVEFHPYPGTFAIELRHSVTSNLGSLLRMPAEQIQARELTARVVSTPPGLKVLFGPQTMEECGEIDPAAAEAVMRELGHLADYIFIDLAPDLSKANRLVIDNSNFVCLVVDPDPATMQAAQLTLRFLRELNVADIVVNPILVNRGVTNSSLRDLQALIGRPIFGIMPPAGEALMAAHAQKTPLVAFKPEHIASSNLFEIARRLAADEKTPAHL